MARPSFSLRAKADLISIYRYSVRMWGQRQAEVYADELDACFLQLLNSPMLGRAADEIRKGLRRIEQGKHVIFYRVKNDEILIVSIQHERRMPK